MNKIDLHLHTTVSDGTDTPQELLTRVKETGISLFSITDHDAIRGCRMIRDQVRESGLRFITGVEFSCRDEQGKYHILGYGYDPDASPVQAVVELGHGYRMEKVRGRLACLQEEFHVTFPQEEIDRLLSLDNPGKPHIGNLMVKYGYAATKEEAILHYINQVHFSGKYVCPEEAIRGILGAGGIPVLAHPSYGSGDELIMGEEMKLRLQRLTAFGLQGLEAYYSGFTPAIRSELLSFADTFGLYVTAGSDYHGRNKMILPGDTGLEAEQEMPEGMKRFLAALKVL